MNGYTQKLCKMCGKPINNKYNIFCNRSCSAKYNNLHRTHEQHLKQAETLRNTLSKNKKNKINYCKVCGSVKGECPYPEICKKYRVFNSLKKFGFNTDLLGTIDSIKEFNRIKNKLEDFYNTHSSNNEMLIKLFDYHSGSANFIKILKSLNITLKPKSESISIAWLKGKLNALENISNYTADWHTTWYKKEVYLRSTYELEYAKLLDFNKIYYEVESLRIKYYDTILNKYRCAVPDFYLPESNTIVEIKSDWTIKDKVQEMKDKFKAYHELGYNTKLILNKKEVDINEVTEDNLFKKSRS